LSRAEPRKSKAIGGAKGRRRKNDEDTVDMAKLGAADAKKAMYAAVLRKMKEGKKLTAADQQVIRDWETEERAREAEEKRSAVVVELNGGATLEEDLEEWTLRDGVVRGEVRRLSTLAKAHQVEGSLDKVLWRVQRRLLAGYGFEGSKRSGPLTGNEALALQWVKSISQISRTSAQWQLRMADIECRGGNMALDEFAMMVATMKSLTEKRDGLALKVRELAAKEKRAGTGRGQKAHSFEIVIPHGAKEKK
jgi:hypothetical protein